MKTWMPVILPTVALFVLGLLVGRMWLAFVPAIGWPIFYLGLWGYGVLGDGWYVVMLGVALAGVLAVAAGVWLRRLLAGAGQRRSSP